jgi:hypothetical protein
MPSRFYKGPKRYKSLAALCDESKTYKAKLKSIRDSWDRTTEILRRHPRPPHFPLNEWLAVVRYIEEPPVFINVAPTDFNRLVESNYPYFEEEEIFLPEKITPSAMRRHRWR